MNCGGFEELIDDHVEGLLEPEPGAEAAAHLAVCPGCRERVARLQALLRAAGRLPAEIPPSRDLLPGIRAAVAGGSALTASEALKERTRRGEEADAGGASARAEVTDPDFPGGSHRTGGSRPWRLWAGMAAVLVIAAVIVVGGRSLMTGSSPSSTARSGSVSSPGPELASARDLTSLEEFRRAQREYDRATAQLLDVIEKRRDSLPPGTAAVLDENLRIINQAIEQVSASLETAPDDTRQGYILTALYRQKVDLLMKVTHLSS